MKTNLVIYTLPAYWASYLINGDASGINAADKTACDAFHNVRNLPAPADCVEAGFARFNDADGVAGSLGCEVMVYTYILPNGCTADKGK